MVLPITSIVGSPTTMVTKETHIELYVSSLGTSAEFEAQNRYIDRLEALVKTGAIDSYSVTVWGDGISPDTQSAHTDDGREILHRLLTLQQWCHLNDADERALFDIKGDTVSGKSVRNVAIEPIIACEFTGSRLQFATPYADDDRTVSIEDHLDTLVPFSDSRVVPRTDAITIEDPAMSGIRNSQSLTEPEKESDSVQQQIPNN